jgi:hypothetical protein
VSHGSFLGGVARGPAAGQLGEGGDVEGAAGKAAVGVVAAEQQRAVD